MSSKDIIRLKQAEIILISENDVKTFTPLSANKVTTSIINYIVLSQDLQIKKILGSTLFNKLMAEWVVANYDQAFLPDGTGTNPPIIVGDTINYQELYQQIRKPLIFWSYVLALPTIAIKVTESGVMLNNTDFSESAGLVGLNRLVNEGEMVARSYTEQLKDYICDTFSNDSDVQTESKDVAGVSIGIFVPKKRWHSSKRCKNC